MLDPVFLNQRAKFMLTRNRRMQEQFDTYRFCLPDQIHLAGDSRNSFGFSEKTMFTGFQTKMTAVAKNKQDKIEEIESIDSDDEVPSPYIDRAYQQESLRANTEETVDFNNLHKRQDNPFLSSIQT